MDATSNPRAPRRLLLATGGSLREVLDLRPVPGSWRYPTPTDALRYERKATVLSFQQCRCFGGDPCPVAPRDAQWRCRRHRGSCGRDRVPGHAMQEIAWDARASLISTIPTLLTSRDACASDFCVAGIGPTPMMSGSTPAAEAGHGIRLCPPEGRSTSRADLGRQVDVDVWGKVRRYSFEVRHQLNLMRAGESHALVV